MERIWEFAPWMPDHIEPAEFAEHCRFLNSDALYDAGMTPGEKRSTPFPVAQLALTMPSFDVDCFSWEAHILVSERLRRTMALPGEIVDYFPVDASASSATPRSLNYMIMSVAVTESISRAGLGDPFIYEPESIDIRAVPQFPLFRDEQYLGSMFCSDAMAVSVLESGCTGVRFIAPESRDFIRPMRYRTLRGLEEDAGWDENGERRPTLLVEAVS